MALARKKNLQSGSTQGSYSGSLNTTAQKAMRAGTPAAVLISPNTTALTAPPVANGARCCLLPLPPARCSRGASRSAVPLSSAADVSPEWRGDARGVWEGVLWST